MATFFTDAASAITAALDAIGGVNVATGVTLLYLVLTFGGARMLMHLFGSFRRIIG